MALYSQEKLNTLFINQIKNYAIFAMDTRGIITSWNKGAERLKGYTENEIVGQYYGVLSPDEYQQAGLPEREMKIALEQGVYEAEDWRKRKDGALFWADLMLTPIFDEAGQHLGFTKITGDITKQKELQDKLAERQQSALEHTNTELKKINFDLDNFVYTASHNLRSPITNIEGLMDLLQEELQESGCLNNTVNEIVKRVNSSINRFKHTIADLTEISRLQKDYIENPSDEYLDIKEVYEDIIVDLEDPVKRKVCFIQTDFQVHELKFSKKNFRSILYNLISNSIKYQDPERSCIIKISTRLQEPYVLLRVQDNGLGISQHHQQQLYSMFKRFHDHVEGSGIGLYMVKRILDNAGGKIEVESKEGEGTVFKVYFNDSM
ncbi:sensor histidine kinase [Adhaeribacter radiodurans]|uniref:histidine kinase n=1 Tax=Adhaeribacter radiodurans TaxID=2745197 RepID=A0A7L7L7V0_9BACT|nr:PAS domain-containing sensor histidine kinase [Adhaeribacter radiodurans]QMU28843.1 PAS domain-containing sensor histidine kinase [Adhaeribacter radiodurans]